ncbi:MAG: transporter [Elusimicrobiota bacterium]
MRRVFLTVCLSVLVVTSGSLVFAFNQPGLNLSLTSLLDGGPIPKGVYLLDYVQFATSNRAVDKDGHTIPGAPRVSVLLNIHQLVCVSPVKILGGHLGLDLSFPIVAGAGRGNLGAIPVTGNTGGLGDFAFGPFIQWNDSTLLGRPLFHRFEFGTTLPTGKFDPAYSVNPGFNILTMEAFYAFTWMFAEPWETSWRIHYGLHGENDRTNIKPGQVFHFNYTLSRAVHPKLRLGVSGYLLQQATEDRVSGVKATNSRERAFALGPALAYMGKGVFVILSHPADLDARNRFRYSRTTLQFIHRF